MIYFREQYVTVWKVEEKENYSVVTMSSGRKNKETGEWFNSNWSFVRFVGEAHKKIQSDGLEERARIQVNGAFNWEPYIKEGERTWAKNPSIVVFGFTYPENVGQPYMDTPPVVEEDDFDDDNDNDEMPF